LIEVASGFFVYEVEVAAFSDRYAGDVGERALPVEVDSFGHVWLSVSTGKPADRGVEVVPGDVLWTGAVGVGLCSESGGYPANDVEDQLFLGVGLAEDSGVVLQPVLVEGAEDGTAGLAGLDAVWTDLGGASFVLTDACHWCDVPAVTEAVFVRVHGM
jgi:hypothetical protein